MTDGKPAYGQPSDRERLFRLLFENLSDAVLWASSETGRIFECNPAAERLFKRSREHLIGLHHRDLYPLEAADRYVQSVTEAAAGLLHRHFDGEILTSRGRVVPVRIFISPAQIGSKPIIQGVFQDKSSRREVVRTLRIAKLILDNSPAVLRRCRAEGEWPLEWIAGNIALFGYSQEDFLSGRVPYLSLVHPEDQEGVAGEMEECSFRGMSSFKMEYRIVPKRGEVRWLDDQIRLERDAGGRVTHFHGLAVDITESKKSELARIQSEDRFRALVETSSDWIWEMDEHGVYTYASPTVQDLLGYKPYEIIGKRPFDLMPDGEAENIVAFFEACRKERAPFTNLENRNLHKDGREVILERSAVPIVDADSQFRGYRGIDRDITQRKRAENEIRQRNRELESLATITHLSSRSLDLDHLLETLLPEIARVLEVRPVLLFLSEGEPTMALRGSFPSPRDENLTERELQVGECLCGLAVAEGMNLFSENIAEDPRCTNEACRNAGLVSVAAIPLRSAHNKTGVLMVASSSPRNFRQNEYFLSTIADSLATAMENADLYQEIRAHAASLERRVAERTAELQTANKELEAFSYTVSHDLRAPLRSIDGFSKALEEEYGDVLDEPGKDYLRRVRDATRRMSQLIDDLLKLSKLTRGELKRQLVDLSALARAVASDLTKSGSHRPVDFVVAEAMAAWGDPRLLQLAMENLIRNAWKFTALQPRARIEVGMVDLEGLKAYFVRDNGVGFNPAHAYRLFQPFQRLHAASEFPGSGIGLATVKRIVHRHGGRVWIEAKEGEGATVYFSL